ncbi:MAG TPA: CehA/McbA family metallohydrolase, partial [Gemmataceae bacterium]|nr:CehA/McbA family metallohydrolase [Gemmataceae bacterium]
MITSRPLLLALLAALAICEQASAQRQVLSSRQHHLRRGAQPEWGDFPKQAEGSTLKLTFPAAANVGESTLWIRQQDVRETWKVAVNGNNLGKLQADENDMTICLAVPAGVLRNGENTLVVEQVGKIVDDIRVGEIALDSRSVDDSLSEATVAIDVVEGERPIPCRLTILDAKGSLATVKAAAESPLAVRPGVAYTGTGHARFTLPAGEYAVFAGRGFEYGIDRVRIRVAAGDTIRRTLHLARDVPTTGWVSCDTHIHTLTFSGHGDATIDERMLTLAGEGIELPIATDHNRQIDYQSAAVKMGVRKWFTPVVGNEVTTPVGHFNLFPLSVAAPPPTFDHKDWKSAFTAIEASGAKAIILNHPRDVHSGFRPFGGRRHISLAGEDLEGWNLKANAMEVVNSGAQQSDVMQLVHDWFGMLNAGLVLTPVGGSDSHDVSRYIVGQGRTYIRCDDSKPGEIDVAAAVDSFVRGRVEVSCGLLTEITINGRYGPGDLVPASKEVNVDVRVLGPSWVKADRVELFANGQKVRESRIDGTPKNGVKWQGQWTLPAPRHDVHYVAVATGPGVRELYWPIARPYQPTAPTDNRRIIGVTGAVWFDGDGDGKRSTAADYARSIIKSIDDIPALARFDEAVAIQAASLLRRKGLSLTDPRVAAAAQKAG